MIKIVSPSSLASDPPGDTPGYRLYGPILNYSNGNRDILALPQMLSDNRTVGNFQSLCDSNTAMPPLLYLLDARNPTET
ncbi:hypothetical protein WG66_013616 [Moniliophthora roreri]|nr:hypothetical protein WG66_013616 [Moniliophthora roreri]